MTWKIQSINGELTDKEFSIDRDMLIGRHQDADILLPFADVSRRHAALLLKDQGLWVQDLKSSNGTFVNDVRIEHDTLLKDSDILQFAGQKFSVLQPAKTVEEIEAATAIPPVSTIDSDPIQQPSEAIAVSETAQEPVQEKTVAEKMLEQGMPDLKERDRSVQLAKDGMPQNVGIPKPAPIPEGVDVKSALKQPEACEVEIPATCVEKELETQKNASVGLFSLIALIIVAIIAWLIFK
ncbi:FHA domain-containing protein [Acinetobacter sp. 194]|uniref:FHA domain-containing protein n=1 Tax=Acinetobacter shaoyimingii TaxID=2715164 RepID=UPI00140944EF|nr:FHA domain-containing protein [Acinetobacter shaoyimingii]NHB59161.1 FHA domain-containing protein [Acinetobacter shaoyimingii]